MKIDISVIIITKNEETNIERCLKSLKNIYLKSNYNFETILIDSNSSDNTVSIAKTNSQGLNLRILNIEKSNLYSASLSRYIGSTYANGEFILFLDGDMELCYGFVENSIQRVTQNICGVIGKRNDYLIDKDLEKLNIYNCNQERIANHFGGALLIQKNALESVGSYNPNLISSEEPDLHLRLKKMGYCILELPIDMINHYEKKSHKYKSIDLLFTDRIIGVGQMYVQSIVKNYYFTGYKNISTKPIFISLTADLFTLLLLIVSLFNLELFFWVLAIQAILLLYIIKVSNVKKFFVYKIYFWGLLKSFFKMKKIKYNLKQIY